MSLGKNFDGTHDFFLDGIKEWINDLQKECVKGTEKAKNDKNREFREKQIVENAGNGTTKVPSDDTSTRKEETHIEEFIQD